MHNIRWCFSSNWREIFKTFFSEGIFEHKASHFLGDTWSLILAFWISPFCSNAHPVFKLSCHSCPNQTCPWNKPSHVTRPPSPRAPSDAEIVTSLAEFAWGVFQNLSIWALRHCQVIVNTHPYVTDSSSSTWLREVQVVTGCLACRCGAE